MRGSHRQEAEAGEGGGSGAGAGAGSMRGGAGGAEEEEEEEKEDDDTGYADLASYEETALAAGAAEDEVCGRHMGRGI